MILHENRLLMKYYALFVTFERNGKIFNCRLLQIIGGALKRLHQYSYIQVEV